MKECGRSSSDGGSPRVILWAGESDFVVGGIRKCSQKYELPLVTVPGSHEHVAFLKPVE
jgi:hypothetical protein